MKIGWSYTCYFRRHGEATENLLELLLAVD